MIRIHDRDIRGTTRTGWLDSRHSFSFGHFHDPSRMGFRSLRVLNDDKVIPGAGFDTHSHQDMEIITYVLEGALAHEDSLGTASRIQTGEIQRMSAGSGIRHSEFNASSEDAVHFLQIWIIPDTRGLPPSYEQKKFVRKTGGFALVADRHGTEGAVTVHQDVKMSVAFMEDGDEASYDFAQGRAGFIHVARGWIDLNGAEMKEGDGAEIGDVSSITVKSKADSEILLFDLA